MCDRTQNVACGTGSEASESDATTEVSASRAGLPERNDAPTSAIVRYQFFFFQAEDGIRDDLVTGVQTCALPISFSASEPERSEAEKADAAARRKLTFSYYGLIPSPEDTTGTKPALGYVAGSNGNWVDRKSVV